MPTTVLTVSAVKDPAPPEVTHVTPVPLVHEVVPHTAPDRLAVAEESAAHKLSPDTVVKDPPVAAALVGACIVTTGAAAAKDPRRNQRAAPR